MFRTTKLPLDTLAILWILSAILVAQDTKEARTKQTTAETTAQDTTARNVTARDSGTRQTALYRRGWSRDAA